MKHIIAIVGRPNVGKSTLFNRILGGRKAITLDEPGVTRDRHYGAANWDGHDFSLIDTGGLFLTEAGSVEKKIREQVDLAIREASVILFVMDGRAGLIPDEKAIAAYLRRSGKPVLFVANKIDGLQHQDKLGDFYALGEEILGVSAEHGYAVNDLLDRVVSLLPSSEGESKEEAKPIRVAILGRPNVGKSSLLNRLLGEERAVVHNEPGTTRDAIDTSLTVDGQNFLLIDTAGIRRGAKSASKVERYSVITALRAIERSDVCLMVLDAVEGLHRQDAHVAGHIAEAKKGLVILWNKWDAVDPGKKNEKRFVTETYDHLKFLSHAPNLFVSARTGHRFPSLRGDIKRPYDA